MIEPGFVEYTWHWLSTVKEAEYGIALGIFCASAVSLHLDVDATRSPVNPKAMQSPESQFNLDANIDMKRKMVEGEENEGT